MILSKIVTVTSNKKYYINLGYNIKGWGIIEVPIKRLLMGSHVKIEYN